ncbi:MAG: hypothetical protein V5783_10220 [Pontiella sp.]
MKKTLATLLSASAIFLAISTVDTLAARENDPDRREVESLMKEIGGEHYVERMRISALCSLEFEKPDGEDDYYHIYDVTLRDGGYRIIIYNNIPEYLGYYEIAYEASDYEKGTLLLDSGESNEDGDLLYYSLPIPDKGPAAKVRINGVQVSFVKNPNLEVEKIDAATGGIPVVPKETSDSGEVIDYRDWTITMGGRDITVNAIFEKVEKGKVYIKNSKNGKVAAIPGSALSDKDKEYVTRITAK